MTGEDPGDPHKMVSLTLLLAAAEHASMAVAGLVVAGAHTLAEHAPGPFGRNESSGGGRP